MEETFSLAPHPPPGTKPREGKSKQGLRNVKGFRAHLIKGEQERKGALQHGSWGEWEGERKERNKAPQKKKTFLPLPPLSNESRLIWMMVPNTFSVFEAYVYLFLPYQVCTVVRLQTSNTHVLLYYWNLFHAGTVTRSSVILSEVLPLWNAWLKMHFTKVKLALIQTGSGI